MSVISSILFYIILFSSSVFLYYLGDKKKSKLLCLTAVMIPVIIGGLRYYVGTDYATYVHMFNTRKTMNLSGYIAEYGANELAFFGIIKFSNLFSMGAEGMFCFFNLITILFCVLAIKNISNKNGYLLYCLVLFIFLPTTWNIIRQGAAIAVMFYAFSLLLTGKNKRAVIWSFVPSLFHTSGLIAIPIIIYFLLIYRKPTVNKWQITFFTIGMIMFAILTKYATMFLPIFAKYDQYNTYNIEVGNNYAFALQLAMLAFICIFAKPLFKERNNIILLMVFIARIVFTALGFSSAFTQRISSYFFFGDLCLFANMVQLPNDITTKRVVRLAIVVCSITYFIFAYGILKHASIVPYNFLT